MRKEVGGRWETRASQKFSQTMANRRESGPRDSEITSRTRASREEENECITYISYMYLLILKYVESGNFCPGFWSKRHVYIWLLNPSELGLAHKSIT